MYKNIIQLLGVHGSGKTYLLEHIDLTRFNVKVFDFGSRIRELMKNGVDFESARSSVSQIASDSIFPLIMTSHFVHKTENGYIHDISEVVLDKTAMLIHLVNEPSVIYSRLATDLRDRKLYSELTIAEYQNYSIEKTVEKSITKKIPFLLLNPDEDKSVEMLVRCLDLFDASN